MADNMWYCPATEKKIAEVLCWEYCFAGSGGPADTANELEKWIKSTKKFEDTKDFHKICEGCIHYQWAKL